MSMMPDGGFRYLAAEIAERPWLGEGDDVMKVVHVDEAMGQVVFLQRFGRNSTHLRHTHHCTAVAYTLSGAWAYDGEKFPAGAVGFEPMGTTHAAQTVDGDTAEVLVVLTAGSGRTRLLELFTRDGRSVELDLPAFVRLRAMTSPAEWGPFVAELAATGCSD